MSIDRYAILCEITKKEYPRFKVMERDKSWLRPVFWVLGKITRRDYSTFTTTVGSTMYVGPTFSKKSQNSKYKTLRHEKRHIKQVHCFPFGRWAWPVNHLIHALLYMLVLPIILTFRAKFEREGYIETLLVEYELRGEINPARMEYNAHWLAKTFGGSTYFFMWRKKAAYRWAIKTQQRIIRGEIRNERDRVEPLSHSADREAPS